MEITLRQAKRDDLDILLPLAKMYHEFESIHINEQGRELALAKILQEPLLGYVWLVEKSAEYIGYIIICLGYSVEFSGQDAFIDEFYIIEKYRGMGIGSKVLSYVKQVMGNSGIKALHLEVERNNHKARRLYEKAGFTAREKYILMTTMLDGKA